MQTDDSSAAEPGTTADSNAEENSTTESGADAGSAAEPGWGPEADATTRRLRYAGAALALVVAALHLFHPDHGVLRLFELLLLYSDPSLLAFDPRPALFVLSGTALVVGVSLSRNAPNRRPYYVAGIALALTYALGYLAWHFSGHGGFLPGREPLLHGVGPVENVVAHLTTDLWAAASMAAELALVAVLAALLARE